MSISSCPHGHRFAMDCAICQNRQSPDTASNNPQAEVPESVSGLPVAVWSGEFQIGNLALKCHTLDNGTRIIEEDSMNAFFEALCSNQPFTYNQSEIDALMTWRRGQ